MTQIGPKRARLRLEPKLYSVLRQEVLHRDGWRCQVCGTMSNLEVHHTQFRSQAGHDSEENLITLCNSCHGSVHLVPRSSRVTGIKIKLFRRQRVFFD